MWIGTRSGGVSRFTNGRFTTWSTSNGLPSNHILSFFEDRSGAMWIGTHGGGLTRLKDGKLATITTSQGLYDNLAFQILEDDQGDLWMSANKGLYRVSLNELNAVADGKASTVTSFVYGVADGMLSRECNGGSPAGWKTRDGRLWFATVKGVVAIDPKRRAPATAARRHRAGDGRPAGAAHRVAHPDLARAGQPGDRLHGPELGPAAVHCVQIQARRTRSRLGGRRHPADGVLFASAARRLHLHGDRGQW